MVHVQHAGTGGNAVTDAKWTFMVYMAANNNLDPAAKKDLAEMRSVGSTPDVNVVVEIDTAGNGNSWRYKIERDGKGELREKLGETNSGDPETLFKFVRWAAAKYPAEHYALVLWNHGSGWASDKMDRLARFVGSAGYTGRETTVRAGTQLRRAMFRPTLETIYRLPTATKRAIASDDGSGDALDTVELGKVIKRIHETLGQKIDVLGLDACLMSSLEVAWELQDDVAYMVGSLANEPNDGWPYDAILKWLTTINHAPKALAQGITQEYRRSYKGHPGTITQSAFDLSKIRDLELPLACLCKALTGEINHVRGDIYKAQARSANFHNRTLWDLGAWCRELRNLNPSRGVDHATKCVMDALEVGGFVIANEHSGYRVRGVLGVSIYLPPELISISRYYDNLRFARDTRWQGMLLAYHNGARSEPVPRGGAPEASPWRDHGTEMLVTKESRDMIPDREHSQPLRGGETRKLTKPDMLRHHQV